MMAMNKAEAAGLEALKVECAFRWPTEVEPKPVDREWIEQNKVTVNLRDQSIRKTWIMVEVTQEVRDAADRFVSGSIRRSLTSPDWQLLESVMTDLFNAGRASAVQWLRDDANMTEIEARRILGNLVKLTPADTADWAKLILMKHGIADALEKLT